MSSSSRKLVGMCLLKTFAISIPVWFTFPFGLPPVLSDFLIWSVSLVLLSSPRSAYPVRSTDLVLLSPSMFVS